MLVFRQKGQEARASVTKVIDRDGRVYSVPENVDLHATFSVVWVRKHAKGRAFAEGNPGFTGAILVTLDSGMGFADDLYFVRMEIPRAWMSTLTRTINRAKPFGDTSAFDADMVAEAEARNASHVAIRTARIERMLDTCAGDTRLKGMIDHGYTVVITGDRIVDGKSMGGTSRLVQEGECGQGFYLTQDKNPDGTWTFCWGSGRGGGYRTAWKYIVDLTPK